MKRRSFSMMVLAGVLAASMATAETYSDLIVRQLVDQGFVNVQVDVTLLGRVRIRAEGPEGMREIILNPNTGEILRDLWLDANGNPVAPILISRNDDDGLDGDDDGSDDDDGEDDDDGGEDDDDGGDDDGEVDGSDGDGDNSGSGSDDGDDEPDDEDDDSDDEDDELDD